MHSQWTAVVVLAVVIFLFNNLREKGSAPLTEESGTARCTTSCSTRAVARPVRNHYSRVPAGVFT